MPKGPQGQKRPADVIGNAVKVMRIATGEEEEEYEDDGKDPAAKALGAKGGKARAGSSPLSAGLRSRGRRRRSGGQKSDFKKMGRRAMDTSAQWWRRRWDSNPRDLLSPTVLKTAAFNRSATPPWRGCRLGAVAFLFTGSGDSPAFSSPPPASVGKSAGGSILFWSCALPIKMRIP